MFKKAAKGVIVGTTLAMITNGLEKDNGYYKKTQEVNYSDAICAIMNSTMLSSYKSSVSRNVKRAENEEYYKAIISIVNSDMLDCYKFNAIRSMN